jgi:hypothetical protein
LSHIFQYKNLHYYTSCNKTPIYSLGRPTIYREFNLLFINSPIHTKLDYVFYAYLFSAIVNCVVRLKKATLPLEIFPANNRKSSYINIKPLYDKDKVLLNHNFLFFGRTYMQLWVIVSCPKTIKSAAIWQVLPSHGFGFLMAKIYANEHIYRVTTEGCVVHTICSPRVSRN